MKNTIKVSIVSLFLAVMLMSFSTNSNAPTWVTHVDSLGFKIDFPSTPTRNLLPLPAGFDQHIELSQVAPGHPRFYVEHFAKKGPYVNVPTVLNDLILKYAGRIPGGAIVGGSLTGPTPWKGGQEMTAKIIGGALHIDIRSYVRGNISFILVVENRGAYAPAASVTKFWNSFLP